VTDIRLPIMDGVTLLRRVGAMDTSLPGIIFISGFGEVDQKEMYALGAQAFLPKPIAREDFIAVVKRALAERSVLWLTPLEDRPRQSVIIQAEDADDIATEQKFRVGRGGFCAHFAGVLGLGEVFFRCEIPPKPLETEHHEIAGEGYVRWHSKTDQKVGIEFAFLEGTSRTWLLDEIASTNPRSFIPSS
jgi:hypothetical protein